MKLELLKTENLAKKLFIINARKTTSNNCFGRVRYKQTIKKPRALTFSYQLSLIIKQNSNSLLHKILDLQKIVPSKLKKLQ